MRTKTSIRSTALNQLLILVHTERNVVVRPCKSFSLRTLATASCSDEFQSAIFRKFSKHISWFLRHPVVMSAPNCLKELN